MKEWRGDRERTGETEEREGEGQENESIVNEYINKSDRKGK